MARTPFKLKSGNAPLKKKGGTFDPKNPPTSTRKKINIKAGLDKFFGSLTKEATRLGKSVKKVVKTDVPKKFAKDVKTTVSKISTKNKELNKKRKNTKPAWATKKGGNIFKK